MEEGVYCARKSEFGGEKRVPSPQDFERVWSFPSLKIREINGNLTPLYFLGRKRVDASPPPPSPNNK